MQTSNGFWRVTPQRDTSAALNSCDTLTLEGLMATKKRNDPANARIESKYGGKAWPMTSKDTADAPTPGTATQRQRIIKATEAPRGSKGS